MKTLREMMDLIESAQTVDLTEGIMDVIKQTFNDNVVGWPMGTSDEQFIQGWARDIKDRTGVDVPTAKLVQLYNHYTKRSPELMQTHSTTNEQDVAEGSFAHDQLKGEINDLFKPVVLQIVKWARAEGMTAKDLAGTSSHFFLDALDPDTYDRTQHLPDNYFNKLMDKANAKAVEILKKKGVAEGSDMKVPTEDGIGWQDIRLMASEGKLTQKTIQQAINIIRKQRKEKQGVAEADETSWTANSAQFRKEEDLSWTVEVTLEPRADINQGRGRRVKTQTVTAQSKDAAKKKLADYYRKNGWEVVGIKFAGDLAEGEDKVRQVNDAEYYHLKLLAKEAGVTLTGMGADKVTGDLHWQGDTRDGRRVSGTVKKVIDDNGEYIQGAAEEQLEETETDPIRRIEELFRNK